MQGTASQARDYAFKVGSYAHKDGCVQQHDGVELGDRPEQGARTDLASYAAAVDSGESTWGELVREHAKVTAKYLGWAKEVHRTRKRKVPGPSDISDLRGVAKLLARSWIEEWLKVYGLGGKVARNIAFVSGPAHGSGKSTVANKLAAALTNMGYSVPFLSGKETLNNVLNIYEEGNTPVIIYDLAKAVTHTKDAFDGTKPWKVDIKPQLQALIENLSDGGIRTSTKYQGAQVMINSMVLVFTNLSPLDIRELWPNRGLIHLMGEQPTLLEMFHQNKVAEESEEEEEA
jgi:hypothetical protein